MQTIDLSVVLLIFLYVLCGSVAPILIELLVMSGAANASTMLVLLPSCVGQSLSALSNSSSFHVGTICWSAVLLLTVLDLASARLTNQGMIDAGSTVYTVVHCSGTVFTALFAVFLLRRHINSTQWFGILIISIGLCVISFGMKNEGNAMIDGILFILLGSVFHSLSYIVIEYSLVIVDNPVTPEFLCGMLGLTGCFLNITWQCVYTIPNYNVLVIQSVKEHNGDALTIILAYIALTVASCVSSTCFYNLLTKAGSSTTGVIKALQAVLTFVTSHYAFCRSDASQCFTATKGASLAIVLLGVLIYCGAAHGVDQTTAVAADGENVSAILRIDADLNTEYTPILEKELELTPLLPKRFSYDSINNELGHSFTVIAPASAVEIVDCELALAELLT